VAMAIVLRPHGKLDARGGIRLRRKLEKLVASSNKRHTTWIVDLADVREIDRNGLTALLALRRCSQNRDCRLLLRDVSEPVWTLLEVAHLDETFEIRNSKGKPRKTPPKSMSEQTLGDAERLSDVASDVAKRPPAPVARKRPKPLPPVISQPPSVEIRDSYSVQLEA